MVMSFNGSAFSNLKYLLNILVYD
jgi:hypothetical protein